MVNLSQRKSTSDLQKARIGSTIVLAGWVEKSKHLGKLAFLNLRDREGYAQIVANKKFMGLCIFAFSVFLDTFFTNKFYTKFLVTTMSQRDMIFQNFVELFNDECSFSKDF